MDNKLLLETVNADVEKNLANRKERRFVHDDVSITLFRYFDDEAPDIRVQWSDDYGMSSRDLLKLAVSVYDHLCDHSLSAYKDNCICITVDRCYFELGFYYYYRR